MNLITLQRGYHLITKMNNNKGVSVIICCHNSAKRIIATLNSLAAQVQDSGMSYEIILVDNNCSDDTIQTANQYWHQLGTPYPFTFVHQPIPGLTYARQKGIASANFDYVILCDDDNWLCSDYLQKTINIFEALPDVALIGGVGEAVFECNPPEWFHQIGGFGYAVGSEGRSAGYVDSLYGAGMGIRKSVYEKLLTKGMSFILSDRKGNALSSGGDVEMCIIFNKAGYKIYFDTALCFKHFIAANRLRWNYYLQLRKAFGVANAYLQAYQHSDALLANNNFAGYIKRYVSYSIFLGRRIHFFLFPLLFKSASCAGFVQILSMRKTLLLEGATIRSLAKSIHQPV